MKAPKIGLIPGCTDCDIDQPKPSEGTLRALRECGAEAVVFDYHWSHGRLNEVIDGLDGFMLLGGCDIDPRHFGEAVAPECGKIFPERDEIELFCLRRVFERDLPIMTICRGTQVLNVFLGGTLYQDLPSALGTHHDLGVDIHPAHVVRMREGSTVSRIAGAFEMPTNSSHHQSVKDLGDGLVVSARMSDGVIEAIERPGSRFVLGLQWHPELTLDQDDTSIKFFRALVAESANTSAPQ